MTMERYKELLSFSKKNKPHPTCLNSPHYSKLADRLSKKIYRDTGEKCDPYTFVRIYSGRKQKYYLEQWTWEMNLISDKGKTLSCTVGSGLSVTELLKKKNRLVIYGGEVCIR